MIKNCLFLHFSAGRSSLYQRVAELFSSWLQTIFFLWNLCISILMYVYIYIIKSLFSIAKQLLRKGIMSLQNIDMYVHNEFCVCIGMEGTHTYICTLYQFVKVWQPLRLYINIYALMQHTNMWYARKVIFLVNLREL